MRLKRNIILTLILVMVLSFSGISVCASTDIYPDLFEFAADEDGIAYNWVSGEEIPAATEVKPLTVLDEGCGQYFLRVDPASSSGFYAATEGTDVLARLFKVIKEQEPDYDLSFAWELMIRLPQMPENMTEGTGYYASGGFGFYASENQGHFKIQSGTSDADAQDHILSFDMEANKWYHCLLIYDDMTHQFYAYVNGERATAATGEDYVVVEPLRFSYVWHWGLQIGGGHIDRKAAILAQDVAICNLYSQVIPEEDALEIYEYVAEEWGLSQESATPSASPTATPTPSVSPTTSAESMTTESATNSGQSNSDNSNSVLIIAIVAAVLVIAGGVVAGILVVKKRK